MVFLLCSLSPCGSCTQLWHGLCLFLGLSLKACVVFSECQVGVLWGKAMTHPISLSYSSWDYKQLYSVLWKLLNIAVPCHDRFFCGINSYAFHRYHRAFVESPEFKASLWIFLPPSLFQLFSSLKKIHFHVMLTKCFGLEPLFYDVFVQLFYIVGCWSVSSILDSDTMHVQNLISQWVWLVFSASYFSLEGRL